MYLELKKPIYNPRYVTYKATTYPTYKATTYFEKLNLKK